MPTYVNEANVRDMIEEFDGGPKIDFGSPICKAPIRFRHPRVSHMNDDNPHFRRGYPILTMYDTYLFRLCLIIDFPVKGRR